MAGVRAADAEAPAPCRRRAVYAAPAFLSFSAESLESTCLESTVTFPEGWHFHMLSDGSRESPQLARWT